MALIKLLSRSDMHMRMHLYACNATYTHKCIYQYVCVLYVSFCPHVPMYLSYIDLVDIYIHIYTHISIYLYTNIHTYICIYICLYININIYEEDTGGELDEAQQMALIKLLSRSDMYMRMHLYACNATHMHMHVSINLSVSFLCLFVHTYLRIYHMLI